MIFDTETLFKFAGTSLFAGAVAILATVVIERLGGRLGGVLATIPTTIVPASLGFWYLSKAPGEFENALWSVPMGMLLNAAFLHSWHWMPRRVTVSKPAARLTVVVIGSLTLWFVLALLSVQAVSVFGDSMWAVGIAALLIQFVYGIFASRADRTVTKAANTVGWAALLARGIMAALAIAAAAVIIALGHPVLAGVASVFPAIFLTIMVSVWISQGEHFPSTAVGSMMLGSTSVSAYALASIWLFAWVGPPLGALFAWCVSVIFVSVPCAHLLNARRR